jgi:holo-[acyl-carrier protein] synthase
MSPTARPGHRADADAALGVLVVQPPSAAPTRVGIDLVWVDEVASSMARFGDRYLRRLFTDGELADATVGATVAAAPLAARFAAKEAALKVLRPDDVRPEWRSIEVIRRGGGWTGLALHGLAADLAARDGLDGFAVSLTHEGAAAAAVVVATGHREPAGGAHEHGGGSDGR